MIAYHLRLAKESDFEFWKELHWLTLRNYDVPVWSWNPTEQEVFFRGNFRSQELKIIEIDGLPAGILQFVDKSGDLVLDNFLIKPELQRRGIGTSLLKSLLEKADNQSQIMILSVLTANPAHLLYRRLGFKVIEESDSKYLMKREPNK